MPTDRGQITFKISAIVSSNRFHMDAMNCAFAGPLWKEATIRMMGANTIAKIVEKTANAKAPTAATRGPPSLKRKKSRRAVFLEACKEGAIALVLLTY